MQSMAFTKEIVPEMIGFSTDRQMESKDFESSFMTTKQRVDYN